MPKPERYNGTMNLSQPILLCHQNEDFRSLIRDMLTKNGFFHVVEANSPSEMSEKELSTHFLVLEGKSLVTSMLSDKKNFLIIAQSEDPKTLTQVAVLGPEHFLSFPFSSQRLIGRILKLL